MRFLAEYNNGLYTHQYEALDYSEAVAKAKMFRNNESDFISEISHIEDNRKIEKVYSNGCL